MTNNNDEKYYQAEDQRTLRLPNFSEWNGNRDLVILYKSNALFVVSQIQIKKDGI